MCHTRTGYTYVANGIDLLNVRQLSGGTADPLARYDGYGRVSSVTEPDGYAVTMLYDALNRLTRHF